MKYLIGAVAILLALVIGYFYQSGSFAPYFNIEWDEEVKMHDGQVVIVHMKRKYERLNLFSRWRGIHRATEISFDTGGALGRFSKEFLRYDVDFVEKKDGYWYIYLVTTTGTPPEKLVDWRAAFLILSPDGRLEKASSWKQLPQEFKLRNIMPPTPNSEGILKFNGTLLRDAVKQEHWRKFPAAAGDDGVLRRPKDD